MNPRQFQQWTVTRANGRRRYILFTGVVAWGLITGVLWAIAMSATQGWDRLWVYLPISLILFPIGGYFFGALTWKWTERQYQKALTQGASPEEPT